MKKFLYPALLLILLAGTFLAGSWYTPREIAGNAVSEGRRVLYYVDPMNPSHTSENPGLAPCGMKMEPVYAEGQGQTAGSMPSMPPGTVKISPEKQQIIGVKVGLAEKTESARTIRTLGRVAVDENRIHRLVSPTEGWLRNLREGTTGSLVKKDQILATFYSRDLLSGIRALFFAITTIDRYKETKSSEEQMQAANQQIQAAEANLLALGMSRAQMKEMERDRKPAQEIEVRAPVTGFVLQRGVFPDYRFDRNSELYRIADLSRVWVLADMYESEAYSIKPGSDVRISLPYAGKRFHGKVSHTLPQFDAASRTFKVRLDVDNPEYALRPDMFVDVEFSIGMPPAITVPVDAVLDSGLKKTVFVDLGNGYFEPRRVQTGWRGGDRVEITGGLMPGERIVVSGNFLLDSESRMKLAAAGMYGALTRDLVCGMDLDEGKAKAAGWKSEYQDKTYYFCSEQCKQEFENDPGRFVEGPPQGEGEVVSTGVEDVHKMHHHASPGDAMEADEGEATVMEEPLQTEGVPATSSGEEAHKMHHQAPPNDATSEMESEEEEAGTEAESLQVDSPPAAPGVEEAGAKPRGALPDDAMPGTAVGEGRSVMPEGKIENRGDAQIENPPAPPIQKQGVGRNRGSQFRSSPANWPIDAENDKKATATIAKEGKDENRGDAQLENPPAPPSQKRGVGHIRGSQFRSSPAATSGAIDQEIDKNAAAVKNPAVESVPAGEAVSVPPGAEDSEGSRHD
jgi:membrane fusion protein, copper/silver efflux system